MSKEFEAIVKSYEASGGAAGPLLDDRFASLVVSENRILRANGIPGIRIRGLGTPMGARVAIIVNPGTIVARAVHLCFGVLPAEGIQKIVSTFDIGEGARVSFIAHCTFPDAVRVKHVMDAKIRVGRNAECRYTETHYHGEEGGVEVFPRTRAKVEEGGLFRNAFHLVQGAAGVVKLEYSAELSSDAVCELDARIYGKRDDRIHVKESLFLNGERARGLAKSRIVASDRCVSEVVGEAVGNAPGARGHVDCVEIVRGKHARASAVPRLQVVDDRAKLTHEAAIGSVDKKQVETLMARGLTEGEAVDVVVKGMLR